MSTLDSKLRSILISIVMVLTAVVILVPSEAGNPEPPRTTDFDSPVNAHLGPRPLLVVLLEFTDLPGEVDASYIENQIFGPRPSMNDYFNETSYNQFWFEHSGHFTWITSWDDPLTPEDESTRAYWKSFADPVYRGGTFYMHGLISLDKAGFDFAPFDLNIDGEISMGRELAYLIIPARETDSRGGATRTMPDTVIDGKTVKGRGCAVSDDSPWIALYAHELGHQTLGLPDYYTIKPKNIGLFSLMGYSGYTNGSGSWWTPIGPHHLDPYSKLKSGWYPGTVVTSDGFYDIDDAETNDVAYILHDPANGKEEYFMVENRWKGTSYDNAAALIPAMVPPLPPAAQAANIPDQGLLVWHVDETRNWNGSETGGYPKVNLSRRDLTNAKAAFNGDDPDYYDFWDGSAPVNSNWNGGADSKTGVWCVSDAGPTMRAWLDVPGPGILPCPVVDSASAEPGSAGTLTVKLTNTGDAADIFVVSVVGLDPDLSASLPGPVALGAKSSTTVDVLITPDRLCTTSTGTRSFNILAMSDSDPTVWASIGATLDVLPFSEPQVSLSPAYRETEPNNTVTYTVDLTNNGNVLDTMWLSFTGLDFGSAYLAFPTAIPLIWISYLPVNPQANACDSTSSTLSISVPWDWAAMEDALYEFEVTTTGSATGESDTTTGQLLVQATPLSMMFWVKAEIQQLLDDVDALPPSDVRDGLHDKATAALNKVTQGLDRYILGDDPPSSNHFRTTQNILRAFIHLLHAQSGKQLTVAQANDFEDQVNLIIDHLDTILAEM
ncbi:MAG: hypothetical protein KAR39_08600 [Thermoplasmata archaeon]|nr:hypothetical protein [Thermoplasmata archaeon]